jgi:signal peptidase II
MGRKRLARKYWILSVALPSILVLDQIIKAVVERTVPLYGSIPVIPGFFSITNIRNTGAAFGLFGGNATIFRTLFFTAVTVGALVLILVIFKKIRENRILLPLSLVMIMAGAVGNLVDRIRLGYVTDFLDFYWRAYHWPAFNIADSAITVGVLLLFIDNLLPQRKEGGAEAAPRDG